MVIRTVFLGTPDFAVPSLEALVDDSENRFEVAGVVTQPDRPAGRGRRLQAPAVKSAALRRGLPLLQTRSLRRDERAFEWISSLRPDILIVVAFGQILPRRTFDLPPHGTVNVHASLLPKFRGAAPVAQAILEGESVTGVTIMLIEEGLDSGDVLSMSETPIDANVTRGELEPILAAAGARLLVDTVPRYVSGELLARPQDHELATRAPRIKKEDGRIDWTLGAKRVHDRIRAFNPWPASLACFRGEPIKIWESRTAPSPAPQEAGPGRIVSLGSDGIQVACGNGSAIFVRVLQPPNRKRLSAADFRNGFAPKVGEAFT